MACCTRKWVMLVPHNWDADLSRLLSLSRRLLGGLVAGPALDKRWKTRAENLP